MIMVSFNLSTKSLDTLAFDLANRNLGGVLFFADNLKSPTQIKQQNASFQNMANTPLLLATDQEGGLVARLDSANEYRNTHTAYELGTEINREDSTRAQAQLMAGWLQQAGFNLNLAPVVDVNVNPNSPAIGGKDRSFSSDEYSVFTHAAWTIDEYQKKNIATALKHFPGHGSAAGDSHHNFTDITNTWEERELAPFKFLIEGGYEDAILTAHVFKEDWDSVYPVSLSEYAISTILRDSLGFKGVIITDELFMKAISDNYGFDEAIIKAVNSDSDILLFNKNLHQDKSITHHIIKLIVQKIGEGVIDEATIDASYNRIIELKQRRVITHTESFASHSELPSGLDIGNYPNPFNPSTEITLTLDNSTDVYISIVNSIGQTVKEIAQKRLSAGFHQFTFDGTDLASGMYMVVVKTPTSGRIHKMMLIK